MTGRRSRSQVRERWSLPLRLLQTGVGSAARHWALASFSLVAAFVTWMIVQDVDNPRVEGRAPESGGIRVRAVNLSNGLIVGDLDSVTVVVESRKDDLPNLRPDDFDAWVDASQLSPDDGEPRGLTVRVTSRRRGVDVISVSPRTVPARAVRAAEKQVPVVHRIVKQPPDGYALDDTEAVTVEPATVKVTGREELVSQVEAVELDVNLGAARGGEFSFEGDLVARTATGNEIQVSLSSTRAQATFQVVQSFVQRRLGLLPQVTGATPGFIVTAVTVKPATILVSGPKQIVDGLPATLNVAPYDITGQRQSATVARNIELPPNISTDPQTVTIEVRIEPILQSATIFVPLSLSGSLPAGLLLQPGVYTVPVRVTGPMTAINALKAGDLKATISLAGAVAGTSLYTATVTAPSDIRIDSVESISLTLLPGIGP